MMRGLALLPGFWSLLFLCSPFGPAQAQVLSTMTPNVLAHPEQALAIVQAAVAARNPDAIAAIFADDARVTNPDGQSITGRAALRQSWADNFAAGYDSVEFAFPKVDLRGQTAILTFMFQARFTPPAQAPFAVEGRYRVDLARQPRGGWLVAAERWSTAP